MVSKVLETGPLTVMNVFNCHRQCGKSERQSIDNHVVVPQLHMQLSVNFVCYNG